MHTSTFFRLFPPPKFLMMKHAGLDISDEAVRCIEYRSTPKGLRVEKFSKIDLPAGLIEGGEIKNEDGLVKVLTELNQKNKLSYVKVSIPEEKAYLFQTDVPSRETKVIRQNIEFKLEENVPIPAAEALFYFDLLPETISKGNLRATVSVVPRAYVEHYTALLSRAGMTAIACEVVPKSIARATIPAQVTKTHLIVHIMRQKIGLYIVSNGVVCFTSTVTSANTATGVDVQLLAKEINRVYQFWDAHGEAEGAVQSILLVGRSAPQYEAELQHIVGSATVPVEVANVWQNVFDLNAYIPPISQEDSLEYAVAAGLAMELLV
jgi:Tfp pilus assembly PilM family ATPase